MALAVLRIPFTLTFLQQTRLTKESTFNMCFLGVIISVQITQKNKLELIGFSLL